MAHFLKTVKNSIKYWYLLLIVGVIFVLLSIWVFRTPVASYLTLSIIFSISFLASGISEIIFSISNRNEIEGWGWPLTFGIITSLMGVVLIIYPQISIATLPLIVGFTIMFRSLQAIGYSFELKNYGVMDWGNLLAVGILGLILSFILIAHPLFTGVSLVVWTALAFITIGVFSIYYSFKLRKINKIASGLKNELKSKLAEVKDEIMTELNKK